MKRTMREALQKVAENPNPHVMSTGGTIQDVLDNQGVLARALLEVVGGESDRIDSLITDP